MNAQERSAPKLRFGASLLAFLAALLLFLSAVISAPAAPVTAQAGSVTVDTDAVFSQIYENASPSVVAINVVSRRTSAAGQSGFVSSSGTGFVIDNSGHVLTNYHVVDNAAEIQVSFIDGTLARAETVGLDADSDLAVLRVDLPAADLASLQPLAFGDSDSLAIGQTVLALGGPFGQRWTLTSGIISALERSISGLNNFSIGGVIQTDAAINPGNSGGPLLNLDGEVIGVNSQIISESGTNSGVGFAVPGNLAERIARQLIERGFVNYSYVGITGGDVSLAIIEAFNLPNDTQGVVVSEVLRGGPAAQAGLSSAVIGGQNAATARIVSADVITAINGEPLSGMSELIAYLANNTQPGQTVTLDVLRSGSQRLQINVTLTARPQ